MTWARHTADDHGVQLWRLNVSSSVTLWNSITAIPTKINHTLQPGMTLMCNPADASMQSASKLRKELWLLSKQMTGVGSMRERKTNSKEIQHGDKTVKSACTVVAASVCWHLSESVVDTTWMRAGWDHDSLWTSTQMVLPSSAPAHNFNCCSSLPEVFLSMLRKLNLRNDWTCRKCARKICTRKDLSWALLPSSHHPPPH
jgi:hypothetical protein